MKSKVSTRIKSALTDLNFPVDQIEIQKPKNPDHGDFSCNIAMILAGTLKKPPRSIAEDVIQKLQTNDDGFFNSIDVAGPGFLNFKINKQSFTKQLLTILDQKNQFGKSDIGKGKRVNVEFVSANPTGPLTVGHGRGAMLGDTVSNILEWNGYDVHREYYFNNAGRQMRMLGESVYHRYLQLTGEEVEFSEDYYQGEYILDIAQIIFNEFGDALQSDQNPNFFKDKAEQHIFKDIKSTLKKLGLEFNHFYNEQDLYNSGKIQEILDLLTKKGMVFQEDGATWYEGTKVGRDANKVLVKKSGEPTYRLPDMAYHKTKFDRGFDLSVDIFGADHIDTYPDVLSVVEQLGYNPDKVRVLIHQFVTILKNGEQVKMSTRKANFVTLDELIDEVGADVVRYFFIMRGMTTHLNFDLDLAKDQSDNNPVFYLQYAHARLCNILKRAERLGHSVNPNSDLTLLTQAEETQLIGILLQFPDVILKCHHSLEPQNMVNYLQDLASAFHKYYAHHKVITDDIPLTHARLVLIQALKIGLKNGLEVIGISAPDKM